MENYEAEIFEPQDMEQEPKSEIRMISLEDLQQRAKAGRKKASRVLEVFPGGSQSSLKAHADPFDTAIEAEVA